ncbi:hypothetical protein COY90_05145 [Candidatus Roizmanbacteria bacterium CG_4_10_14_0_8_um_filter_39_9]|uniref:4Fe-4S ferredoxin-type domain-containing protein n=1 Tax=Candidatus Roizmanbacteria bacterium CG_4_10_14_0_8_um_filter_39_9 TaxID=1974829 RepID=A0A2M7QBJ0_9BACT|nr:MAG: hypothetical protein COY90_05145 [Candidatus Roizmanbacteria bacterium CG_4_10_14_0_8_um_filter_39_9]
MRNRTTSLASFTLIELIIVVGLILLFTGFSISYFSAFTERKKIENDSKKIINTLELMKTKTISGDASLCSDANPRLSYFSFETNASNNSYSMVPHCAVGVPTPIQYSLETNVLFYYPTPTVDFSVSFQPITGGTDSCSYIYLKNSLLNNGSGLCRYIKISKSGLVFDDECSTCTTCQNTCP